MNNRLILALTTLLGLGLSQAAAQTTLTNYSCEVTDKYGGTLADKTRSTGSMLSPTTYLVSAATVDEAETKALALANQQHTNQAAEASCQAVPSSTTKAKF